MTSLSPSTVKDFVFNLARTRYAGGLSTIAMMNTYDLKICFKNDLNKFGSYITGIAWRIDARARKKAFFFYFVLGQQESRR